MSDWENLDTGEKIAVIILILPWFWMVPVLVAMLIRWLMSLME